MPKRKSKDAINFLRDADDITYLVTGRRIKDFVKKGVELFGEDVLRKFTGEEKVALAPDNPYLVLEVRPEASDLVVKAAFRAMMLKAHPDVGGSNEAAKRLNKALDEISKLRGRKL